MKHAHLIPLVGGAAIGTSLALNSLPEYIASWPAFAKNDQFCKDYFKNTPFYTLPENWAGQSKMKVLKKVDLITCVPPCSGLSTSTPSINRGCSAPQNEHMLRVARTAMAQGTLVIVIENAPTLYGKGGEEFANRFLPLLKEYDYVMMLLKTSTILHGLPQNRVRSFAILYKGSKLPEFNWIKKPYKALYQFPVVNNSDFAKGWDPNHDELIGVLCTELCDSKYLKPETILKYVDNIYGTNPVTGWKLFLDLGIKHRFKTEPYRYMQKTQESGKGIMDRSPYLAYHHCNALMWKSAHKMINPAAPYRAFNIRELMNLMGMPKDFKEIPAKDINVLFQNVPVTTVKTLIEEIARQMSTGKGWYKPKELITRVNNIKQTIETI